MANEQWVDVGASTELSQRELQSINAKRTRIALTYRDGKFSAISAICNHVGGPLGDGALDGDYVVCPWHFWKFHHRTGAGEPGFEEDRVPSYPVEIEYGRVLVDVGNATPRSRKQHAPHPLARPIQRAPGTIRVSAYPPP